ncbi:RbsD/FucU family protein [Pseudomonas sp. SDO524_S393]
MLKRIDPLLSPELLFVLRSMGHGDDIAIVDRNFPAASVAAHTVHGSAIRIHASAPEVAAAIASVMPIDEVPEFPIRRMGVRNEPDNLPAVQQLMLEAFNQANDRAVAFTAVPWGPFDDEAKRAYAVVSTSEGRGYGCLLIRKGVIFS